MKKKKRAILIILLCIDIPLAAWMIFGRGTGIAENVYQKSGVQTPSVGFLEYTNEQYGFSFDVPADLSATTTFDSLHRVSNNWRYGISDRSTGIPVVSIVTDNITNKSGEDEFYFDAEVRVGVSADMTQVANCFITDDSVADTGVETINGVAFHVYDLQSAGMSQYVLVKSYRTVRNDKCYAIESIIAGGGSEDTPQGVANLQILIAQNKIVTENIIRTIVFK